MYVFAIYRHGYGLTSPHFRGHMKLLEEGELPDVRYMARFAPSPTVARRKVSNQITKLKELREQVDRLTIDKVLFNTFLFLFT